MTLFKIPRTWQRPERDTAPESVYWSRRQILKALGLGSLGLLGGSLGSRRPALGSPLANPSREDGPDAAAKLQPAVGERYSHLFPSRRNPHYTLGPRTLTPEEIPATFNNFYEFSTGKDRVWKLAQGYPVDPWKVEVAGLVKEPRTLDLDDLFRAEWLEERLYRFRCVERWSMQVPWTGYPLASLIRRLEPLPSARYVRFVSLQDPEHLPGQRGSSYYPWPYYEALRMDEALNELAFVAVGIYGHALPMQFGAPWRIVTPWKYGYKSPKSIVRIEFTAEPPGTFWSDLQPKEYGFYSNVNPQKPHPRWSQAREEDIGTGERRDTLLYNGYYEAVAGLYDGSEI